MEVTLAAQAVDAVLRGQPLAEVSATQARRRDTLQQRQAALTDFRIYWESLGQALMGRDIILIDADNIRGQRNLFLFDPDSLRAPLLQTPVVPRTPMRRTSREVIVAFRSAKGRSFAERKTTMRQLKCLR